MVDAAMRRAAWSGSGTQAGFRLPLSLGGGSLDEAVEFALEVGPASAALREADVGPDVRARVAGAVRAALAPFAGPGGAVSLASAAWLVSARNPSR